jgi:hypothetical protein
MTLDAATIAKELAARDVDLNAPASAEEVKQFEQDMGLTLDPFFRSIYLQFNGFFNGYDVFELWPLAQILQERAECPERERDGYFAIGDFMIHAEFLMCCLTREAAPIFFLHANEELAPTASELFAKFAAGDYGYYTQPRMTSPES